ncbi:uncharacterized protein [Anser cygnoides]|uniref:uncharacterized protein n=1 Tax=Anser cygnoides TaxID=8845 RepID=UPI0034D31C3A
MQQPRVVKTPAATIKDADTHARILFHLPDQNSEHPAKQQPVPNYSANSLAEAGSPCNAPLTAPPSKPLVLGIKVQQTTTQPPTHTPPPAPTTPTSRPLLHRSSPPSRGSTRRPRPLLGAPVAAATPERPAAASPGPPSGPFGPPRARFARPRAKFACPAPGTASPSPRLAARVPRPPSPCARPPLRADWRSSASSERSPRPFVLPPSPPLRRDLHAPPISPEPRRRPPPHWPGPRAARPGGTEQRRGTCARPAGPGQAGGLSPARKARQKAAAGGGPPTLRSAPADASGARHGAAGLGPARRPGERSRRTRRGCER